MKTIDVLKEWCEQHQLAFQGFGMDAFFVVIGRNGNRKEIIYIIKESIIQINGKTIDLADPAAFKHLNSELKHLC